MKNFLKYLIIFALVIPGCEPAFSFVPSNPNGQTTMANSEPVVIASDQSPIPITGSITASNPSVGSTGASVPASATYLGISVAGNLTGISSANPLPVIANQGTNALLSGAWPIKIGDGAANVAKVVGGSTAPGVGDAALVVTISPNNSSKLALETGGNLDQIVTNTANLALAQGNSTTGEKGNLALVATTTSAPTYSAGTSNPISQTTSGDLRTVSSASSKTQIVDGSGNVIASANNALYVNTPPTTASGSITSTQSVQISGNGYGTATFQVTGTWTGTLTVEGTVDGSNWITTTYVALASGGIASSFSANTIGQVNCAGLTAVRLRGATVASGTAAVTWIASQTTATVMADNPFPVTQSGTWNISNISGTVSLPTGAATSANQSTEITALGTINTTLGTPFQSGGSIGNTTFASTQSGTWANRITDGTNTMAVKAASTAAAATDPSAVIAISPNSNQVILTSANGVSAGTGTDGNLQVAPPTTALFKDSFDGTSLDTTNNWNTPVTAGGGTQSVTSAALSLSTGTTANNAVAISSQPTFVAYGLNQLQLSAAIQFEASTVTGVYKFYGRGTAGTAYSTTNPIKNGVGIEETTGGVLRAVIYGADTLLWSSNLTMPTDGYYHSYTIIWRDDAMWVYVDGSPVASASNALTQPFSDPSDNNTPIRIAMLNGASTLSGTPTFNVKALALGDTGQQHVDIRDATYKYRGVTVKAASTAPVAADPALVVALSPNGNTLQPAARTTTAIPVTPIQQKYFKSTFASVIASGVDTNFFTLLQTGSGQAISQSGGNLVITTGTTANAATVIRSTQSFTGSMLARIQTTLSQRIANNNFIVELVDVIGDNLSTTVNSATSITVTIPSNPFTSANVGQGIDVDNVQNISASAVPMRATIASVSGNNVTLTVAGWPASGSGTCTLSGWNYYQLTYNSTTATNVLYDAQRKGWNSGTTTATINTTASPGHMAILSNNDGAAYLADQLVASVAGTVQTTQRASRVVNLPEENTPLYLQIRAVNGTSAPASTTTWTIGMSSVENYAATPVVINDVKAQGAGSQAPVAVTNTPSVAQSGNWTARIVGNGGVSLDAANNGTAPSNVFVTGAQLQSSASASVGTAGQVGSVVAGLDHVLYTRQGGPVTWTCGLNAVGTTLTQCQAAPGAGLFLYISSIVAQSSTGTAGQFTLTYGTGTNCGTGNTAIFANSTAVSMAAPANTAAPTVISFSVPLKLATAANALCVLGVATNTTNITINGFTAP